MMDMPSAPAIYMDITKSSHATILPAAAGLALPRGHSKSFAVLCWHSGWGSPQMYLACSVQAGMQCYGQPGTRAARL